MTKKLTILFLISCLFQTLHAQNAAARYEIDAKRIGVAFYDKDALPRSREFIRLDSTYYVGWYYEGMYRNERAADYLGYRNCIVPLKKSLLLFEKDFRSQLKQVFDVTDYNTKQTDIRQLCLALYDSYSNIEKPDSAIWVLEKVKQWNLSLDFMDYHIKYAWTVHRNRYLVNKYSFLSSTVEQNEQLALNHLYTAIAEGKYSATFYLAIIHNYLQNIDSTKFYYDYLLENGGISYNNYAHFKNTQGQFAEAINNFEKDKYAFDKRLIESYYFLPILYINSGNAEEGIKITNEIIKQNGSTPGFGWYNIALARSYLYNGQTDSSEKAINKAAQFKELHLGTTLGQAQYDFAVTVVKLMLIKQKILTTKFLNSGWWYTPADLFSIAALTGEQFLLRYAVVSELVSNPERQNVIYNLFTSENVISFDEAWNVLKDISPAYFRDLYEQKAATEKRENIRRYMKFFYGSFLYETGNKKRSTEVIEDVLYNTLLDTAHEKLFIAREYELLAKNYSSSGTSQQYQETIGYLFNEYPQLIPFSGLKIRIKLQTGGLSDDVTRKVVREIKNCDINFTDQNYTALATLTFNKRKDKYEAVLQVTDHTEKINSSTKIIFKNPENASKQIALRMFGIGGPVEID
ncbi:hypothetical protein BH09BAC2_BH09BAC2_09410 [soil metagenome]